MERIHNFKQIRDWLQYVGSITAEIGTQGLINAPLTL